MKKVITGKDIVRQLRADLIGKDSYRGVTLTYTWLANQFGHFSLGFIPTFVGFLMLKRYVTEEQAALYAAGAVGLFWLAFETFNFLGPLLSRKSRSTYVFQPAWGNIAFDTITDLIYFWSGALMASILCAYTTMALVMLLIMTVMVLYPAYYWYLTKMYLQTPSYPFQFRLSQWSTEHIPDQGIALIRRFLDNKDQGMHLFLFGPKRSGKTSLSVGIATEMSIRHRTAVYTSAMKLYCMFFEHDDDTAADVLWTWRKASILVIDDINPGSPIKNDLITPEQFLSFVDTFSTNDINRTVLRQTNVIWVLGDDDVSRKLSERWQDMLVSIGVEKEKLLSLNLQLYSQPVPKAEYDLHMQS